MRKQQKLQTKYVIYLIHCCLASWISQQFISLDVGLLFQWFKWYQMSEEIKSKYQRKQQQPSRTKHCKEQKEVLFIFLDFFSKPKCINPTENSYFKTEFTYNFIRKHELSACYGMSVKIIHYSFLKKITRQSFLNFSYFFN